MYSTRKNSRVYFFCYNGGNGDGDGEGEGDCNGGGGGGGDADGAVDRDCDGDCDAEILLVVEWLKIYSIETVTFTFKPSSKKLSDEWALAKRLTLD